MDLVMRQSRKTTSNVFASFLVTNLLWDWSCMLPKQKIWNSFGIHAAGYPTELDEWFRTCIHDIECITVPGIQSGKGFIYTAFLQLSTMTHLTISASLM